jgi:hypothetical protein
MKAIFQPFFCLCGLLLLCGCVEMTGGFKEEETFSQDLLLRKFPAKFYLETLEEQEDYSNFISWKGLEPAVVRAELCQYWPELFTDKKENALRVKFQLEALDAPVEDRSFLPLTCGLLSMCSLGILPAQINHWQNIKLKVAVEGAVSERDIKLQRQGNWNIGILGFCGTRHLLKSSDNQWFVVNEGGINKLNSPLELKEEHRKDFLRLFVMELYRFPREKMLKLYLTHKTEKTELLE